MEDTTLSAEERNVLERDGVLLPHWEPGKHKIRAEFLARTSIPAARAASGRPTGTAIQPVRANRVDGKLIVPTTLDSAEALEFIGFTAPAARFIHGGWTSRPPDAANNPGSILDFAFGSTGQLERRRALRRCSDREACDEVGLAPWFSNAILHPDRVGVLYTETLLYWVDSSIQMHFDALVRILRKLKAYARARVGPRRG
ncbi:uncharacterized protein J3D65DRAFT_678271 [Phyllosticta citribraziliensis]|uniref:Uncharacterized protein n=1 Tax=Phyllosticta citribraziliensis TaxID=989973 RepID=A0ABR1LHZ4_9PEZI